MSKIPFEKEFVLSDGSRLDSLDSLHYSLLSMSYKIYSCHVDSSKNDFANWIEFVFELPDLANCMRQSIAKPDLLKCLSSYLNNSLSKTEVIPVKVELESVDNSNDNKNNDGNIPKESKTQKDKQVKLTTKLFSKKSIKDNDVVKKKVKIKSSDKLNKKSKLNSKSVKSKQVKLAKLKQDKIDDVEFFRLESELKEKLVSVNPDLNLHSGKKLSEITSDKTSKVNLLNNNFKSSISHLKDKILKFDLIDIIYSNLNKSSKTPVEKKAERKSKQKSKKAIKSQKKISKKISKEFGKPKRKLSFKLFLSNLIKMGLVCFIFVLFIFFFYFM